MAWDTPAKDMIDTYAIFQKFHGQGISADLWVDYSKYEGERVPVSDLIFNYNYSTHMGLKAWYYQNSKGGIVSKEGVQKNTVVDDEEDFVDDGGCDGGACKIVLNINNTGSNLDSFAVSDVIPADSSSYGDPEGTVKNINYCLWFKPEIITTATWVRGGNSCANNMGCLFPQNSCISCGSDNFSLCVNSYCNMNSSRRPGGTGYRCACINFCPLNVLFTTCTMLK